MVFKSKDPMFPKPGKCRFREFAPRVRFEIPLHSDLASVLQGVLRLRRSFAAQSSHSAQDDSSIYDDKLVSVSRIPGF